MTPASAWGLIAAAVLVLLIVFKWINVLREYERGVVFRLGRCSPGPRAPAWCSSCGQSIACCGSACAPR
jgi:hypothetical protein